MPTQQHRERHFTGGAMLRDVVLGMSDGLTVPFALAAGLSGALQASRVVVTAGLAEIAAGSIAMGLGGYLAARGDAEHYASERARERAEVREKPLLETDEVREVFSAYGLSESEIEPIIAAFRRQPDAWVEFMMRFELGLERPDPQRAWRSALTIACAYALGGAVPLVPYVAIPSAALALRVSSACTLFVLALFGGVKARFTGARAWRGALQTTVVGGLAALAAFALARLIA